MSEKKTTSAKQTTQKGHLAPGYSSRTDVDAFLDKARVLANVAPASGPAKGRLIFAMDATASRQPSWDNAAVLQAEMFDAVSETGSTLDIQLVFFRGLSECKASGWCRDATKLRDFMTKVTCQAGHTQLARVLGHVEGQARDKKINALIYVGDCLEEDLDNLAGLAGQLALKGIKAFMFQEGYDPKAETAFREIARITGGAFARFDANAADRLRDLLGAVASYAVGGIVALDEYGSKKSSQEVKLLGNQLRKPS
ncbi:VWA domain-containing protein [Thalassospira australica]|uniref:VWA domain-containing protein n=1 Tax=Thalassospira australica TaxID=1528106 RepID=UPI00384B1535